jgi:hypothetical protein
MVSDLLSLVRIMDSSLINTHIAIFAKRQLPSGTLQGRFVSGWMTSYLGSLPPGQDIQRGLDAKYNKSTTENNKHKKTTYKSL